MYPSCAKLRDECLMIFSHGYNKTDGLMLHSFFQFPLNEKLRASTIKRFDIDKFKPLSNFLRKPGNTRLKNVELLAWLIDFELRPYSKYIDSLSKKDPAFSGMKVSKAGTIVENRFAAVATNEEYFTVEEEVSELSSKLITLEYPSGVKIKVDTNDLKLIAQLVKM